jgi:hypothetical protein
MRSRSGWRVDMAALDHQRPEAFAQAIAEGCAESYCTVDLDPKGVAVVMLRKLRALTQISRMCGFAPTSEEEAATRRSLISRRDILAFMAIMVSPEIPAWQRAACAAVLDILFFRWRDGAPLAAIGFVVDRDSPEVRQWRATVLERDGFACVSCGATDHLEAHHIVRWVDNPALRVEPENGATLCRLCHQNEHRRGEVAPAVAVTPN